MLTDGLGVGRRAVHRHHHGGDALAPLLVGQAHHGALGHVGVRQERLLHLGGRHVLAASDDGVVAAPLDEEVVLVIDPAAVTGGEPALVVERVLPAGVLAGHLLAPHPDLAHLAGAEHLTLGAPHLHLDRRQHLPHRREPADRHRVAVAGGAVVIGAEHGDGRAGLGEAVGVDQVHVGQDRHHPLEHGGRGAGAAVAQRAQGGQALAVGLHDVADARQHRGDDHGVGDLLATHGVDPAPGVELGQVDDAPAGVEVREQVGDAGDVVGRHAHEDGLVLAGAAELDGADDVRGEVAVAQHRGLGRRGRAARVEQDRGGLGVEGQVAEVGAGAGGGHEVLGGDDPVTAGGEVFTHLALGDHQHLAEGDEELVELLVGESVVQGDEGHLGGRRREQPEREGQAIGAHVGEHVGAVDQCGARPGAGQQLGRGQRLAAGLHRDLVGATGRGHVGKQEEVHRRRSGSVRGSGGGARRHADRSTADGQATGAGGRRHEVGSAPARGQSDEGRGLAPFSASTAPSAVSAPAPARVHSSSSPSSSSA